MKTIKTTGSFFVALLPVLFVTVSCFRSGGTNTADFSAIRIRLHYDGSADTRAQGPIIADQTQLEMGPGHIFFTDAAGRIVHHVGIVDGEVGVPYTGAGSEGVSLADLRENGEVIEQVSLSARKCVIVSRDALGGIAEGSGFTGNLEGTNISEVKEAMADVSDMNITTGDDAGSVATVPLFGEGDIVPASGTENGKDYNAAVSVTMNSVASRVQIRQISAATTPTEIDEESSRTMTITGFTVEGIYINNYYEQMALGAQRVSEGDPVHNGTGVANYVSTSGIYFQSTGTGYNLADAVGAGDDGNVVALSGDGRGWVYNLFPTPVSNASAVPHIVIRLSSVTVVDSSAPDTPVTYNDQFLTIGSIRDAASKAEIVQFDRNYLYTLGNIEFSFANLSSIPEAQSIDVLVSVTMMKWNNRDVEWNI
jgi:hypothetical protein